MNNLKAKLSTSTKIGYGVGQLGSGLAYNLFYYYFIYFMTSFAGVSPAAAGTISLFAVIWDAVTDPMVGFLSDSLKIKTGTRRRLMMKASVPLGITVFLLFSSFNFATDGIKIFYYAVVNILFWLFFTMCDIPHITLGQELTEDYDEKSSIRGFSSGFMYAGELVVSGATMILVNRCSSEVTGWRVVAIVTAVLCCLAYFTAGVCTKGKELTISETEAKSNTVSIASFKECFSNKTFMLLVLIALTANCIVGIQASGNIYVQSYFYGLSDLQISFINMGKCFYMIVVSMIIGSLASKIDKRKFMIFGFFAYAFGMFCIRILPASIPLYIFALCFSALGNATFWTLIYSVLADVITLDTIEHGGNRAGAMTSLLSMCNKFGCSFGMWAVGVGLSVTGFDESAAVQSAAAVSGIRSVYGIGGLMFGLIIAILAIKYPYSRKAYNEKLAKLEAAKKN
ncbi:MAG: MFS transporter [Lawsonibacter sp.]|nr:MFS transporter [Lawsonibacter sp.]